MFKMTREEEIMTRAMRELMPPDPPEPALRDARRRVSVVMVTMLVDAPECWAPDLRRDIELVAADLMRKLDGDGVMGGTPQGEA
jgi:hypothetical protein